MRNAPLGHLRFVLVQTSQSALAQPERGEPSAIVYAVILYDCSAVGVFTPASPQA